MESMGNLGHSCRVGFYADGDGDFRPKFSSNVEWENEQPYTDCEKDKLLEKLKDNYHIYNEVTFDAE